MLLATDMGVDEQFWLLGVGLYKVFLNSGMDLFKTGSGVPKP